MLDPKELSLAHEVSQVVENAAARIVELHECAKGSSNGYVSERAEKLKNLALAVDETHKQLEDLYA